MESIFVFRKAKGQYWDLLPFPGLRNSLATVLQVQCASSKFGSDTQIVLSVTSRLGGFRAALAGTREWIRVELVRRTCCRADR